MISVFGKMGYEHMSNIIDDFSKRPETAALVASPNWDPNEPFYEEGSGDKDAQMMILEADEDDSDMDLNGIRQADERSVHMESNLGDKMTSAHKSTTGKGAYEIGSDMMSETTKQWERELEMENEKMKKELELMKWKMAEIDHKSTSEITNGKGSNCCQMF